MKFRRLVPYLLVIAAAFSIIVCYRLWRTATTDTQSPVITIEEGILELSVNDGEDVLLQGVTAYDQQDGDVTASVLVEKVSSINENSEVSVTYCAFDEAGNVAKLRRTVRYTDYHSPVFTLTKPLLYPYGRDVDIISRVGATDCIDGDISHKIKPTLVSEIPVSSEGIHQILFRVTNSLGDTVELKMPAEVYPTGKYNATLSLTKYLTYISVGDHFTAEDYLKDVQYADNIVRLSGKNLPEGYRLVVDGKVDSTTPGVYPISYTLNFSVSGFSYIAYSKLIVIVEG